jgi:hypothetical protein
VNGLAIAALEPGNVGPRILDADREQNSAGFYRRSVAKANGEQLTSLIDRLIDDAAHELDSVLGALGATEHAELGRADTLMAEVAVDAARLPVAGITGVDDYDFVEIAGEPERGAESGGTAADYRNIVWLCGHAGWGASSIPCTTRD